MIRGQVTGFAIAGILILIAAIGMMWLIRLDPDPGRNGGPTLNLETCIENEMLGAIRQIGFNGGVPSSFGGLMSIGTAAGEFGIPPTTRSSISLNPIHTTIQKHETGSRTANNYFYAFDHIPAGSTTGSASNTFTGAITRAVQDRCGGTVEELSVSSVAYSDTSTTLRAQVLEEGRSPREVTISVPIPVRRYHQALHHALRRENREPTYMLRMHPSPDFTIRTAPMNNPNNDTLVMLETDRPLIGAEPFRYLTIIENRPPVYTTDLEAILSCDESATPSSAGILVDPDDLHDPDITECEDDSGTYRFTIESGGKTYTLEVTP